MKNNVNRLFESEYNYDFTVIVFEIADEGSFKPGKLKFGNIEAHLSDILQVLDELYEKYSFSFINELLGLKDVIILHTYRYYGVFAIENYHNGTFAVMIPSEDVSKFLNMLRKMSEERKEFMEMLQHLT